MKAGLLSEIDKLWREDKRLTVALVGSGGKTSLLRYLGQNLKGKVVCTTSTKLSLNEATLFDQHIIWKDEELVLPVLPVDADNVLVTGIPVEIDGVQKLSGLSEEQVSVLNQMCVENQFPLIIEADGAKRRSLKAPEAWEPVIPTFSNLVITVVGLAGLLKPLNEENVFRSRIFSQLSKVELGELVDLQAILRYLRHPLGGQKGIPDNAKKLVLFNLSGCSFPELVDQDLIKAELNGDFDCILYAEIEGGKVSEVEERQNHDRFLPQNN